jgi:RNA polymerase sigma-70 factor (ECF subfamily)
LRRLKDHSEAEDLTQEVLLRVLRASQAGQVDRADGYVFKVAINVLRDRHRRAVRRGSPDFVPLDEALAGDLERQLVEDLSPERVLLSRESLANVLRAPEELGERTRNIFIALPARGHEAEGHCCLLWDRPEQGGEACHEGNAAPGRKIRSRATVEGR